MAYSALRPYSVVICLLLITSDMPLRSQTIAQCQLHFLLDLKMEWFFIAAGRSPNAIHVGSILCVDFEFT